MAVRPHSYLCSSSGTGPGLHPERNRSACHTRVPYERSRTASHKSAGGKVTPHDGSRLLRDALEQPSSIRRDHSGA